MRRRFTRGAIALTLCVLLRSAAGLAASDPSAPVEPAIEGPAELVRAGERAREALRPLKRGLKSALESAMQSSPMEAVDVCQLASPNITADATRAGIRIGRTSHKLRNPANAPAPWMQPLLEAYAQAGAEARPPRVVALDNGHVGYVEPIYTQPLCAICHGTAVDPALSAHIASRYPDDRALGFEVGELRGLFWVEIASEAAR